MSIRGLSDVIFTLVSYLPPSPTNLPQALPKAQLEEKANAFQEPYGEDKKTKKVNENRHETRAQSSTDLLSVKLLVIGGHP